MSDRDQMRPQFKKDGIDTSWSSLLISHGAASESQNDAGGDVSNWTPSMWGPGFCRGGPSGDAGRGRTSHDMLARIDLST
jgi:hypothetical protein